MTSHPVWTQWCEEKYVLYLALSSGLDQVLIIEFLTSFKNVASYLAGLGSNPSQVSLLVEVFSRVSLNTLI